MTDHAGTEPSANRGFSLPEMLVSLLVMAVVAMVALSLYDQARRSMHIGENVAEQQQQVRIALEFISSQLLDAGLNTWPDGDRARPDEQIEAAFEHAIVFRVDRDGQDPVESRDPEESLATGGPYRTVSIGNDEIVAYVVARENSNDTLRFEADVAGAPRDGTVEPVEIDDLDLELANPPYTLYRVTLGDDGSPEKIPVVEQIRTLRFRYYDRFGDEIPYADLGGDETASRRQARALIRRIRVEIEGLTRDQDPKWVDLSDLDPATRRKRKYALATDLKPRNLGLAGFRDVFGDIIPPAPPAAPDLHPGHCNGLWATWSPGPAEDEVDYYRVSWTPASGGPALTLTSVLAQAYLSPLVDGQAYRVTVRAVDSAGNLSVPSPVATATPANGNTPGPLGAVVATRTGAGEVDLSWGAVLENTDNLPAADPGAPALRDLAGYRIYRSTLAGFDPNSVPVYAALGHGPAPRFTDATPISCDESYYRVAAVDLCGTEGEISPEVHLGPLSTGSPPKRPYNEDAYVSPTGEGLRVKWRKVFEDVLDRPTWVTNYVVQRAIVPPPSPGNPPLDAEYEPPIMLGDVDEFFDNPVVPAGKTVIYRVKAIDGCGNESDWSGTTNVPCVFVGALRIVEPAYGTAFSGDLRVRVVLEGGDPGTYFERFRLKARRSSDGAEWEVATYPGLPPELDHVWDAAASGATGHYELTAILIYQDAPDLCESSTSVFVHKVDP